MECKIYFCTLLTILCVNCCCGQILQFGKCADVKTQEYFQLDKFLGVWYEIQRYSSWYELYGQCAQKRIQLCGTRVEIEHIFVKDGIQFVLHVNSTYLPGDEAVFAIKENSVDPVGIPLSVLKTDYSNYAIVYGCRSMEDVDIRYVAAWILSRQPELEDVYLEEAYSAINKVPGASTAYLEPVMQNHENCQHHWTAHVNAENVTRSALKVLLANGY